MYITLCNNNYCIIEFADDTYKIMIESDRIDAKSFNLFDYAFCRNKKLQIVFQPFYRMHVKIA